jgi:predicted deacylase
MNHVARAPAPTHSRISPTIPFDEDGKHCGFLSVPHSTDESAYGRIQIPIACIQRGIGPTALLVAGNHGDEYEGQVALTEFVQDLEPADIKGRVLVVPTLNLPAALAARRCSPIDGGNLNRLFPGDPDGGPTQMIAHYVESVLLPLADISIDLHAGGASLYYEPCAYIRDDGDADLAARQFDALRAFGGDLAYVTDGRNQGAERTFAAAAHRCGVICISAELGGGAMLDFSGVALARDGTRRVLHHSGILRAAPPAVGGPLRLMEVEDAGSYVLAQDAGVFEPAVDVGAEVAPGQIAGRLWYPDTPWRPHQMVRFTNGGHVICKRAFAWTRRGDCLFQVLAPYSKHRSLARKRDDFASLSR